MRTQDELSQTFAHYAALRREMSLWVEQSIQRDGPDRHQGGEDEANYALAFFPQYLISGDERIVERFRSLVEQLFASHPPLDDRIRALKESAYRE